MMNTSLDAYVERFKNLKTAANAPHKPVFLLTIIAEIELGHIASPKIRLTPKLLDSFVQTWAALVSEKKANPNIAQPFYHLQGDGFWHLEWKRDVKQEYLTIERVRRSVKYQMEYIEYAQMNTDLFELLSCQNTRNILKKVLLHTYFSGKE